MAKLLKCFCKFTLIFGGEIIYMGSSQINIDIFMYNMRYILTKILNVSKVLFQSKLYNSVVQVQYIS